MRGFSEREKGLEANFVRREEEAFWMAARRNRLFGLWAANRLGIEPGEAAEIYAKRVVAADFEAPGDEDVLAKVRSDLAAKGVSSSEAELRTAFGRASVEAQRASEFLTERRRGGGLKLTVEKVDNWERQEWIG